jgi:hypothetical protein
MISGGWTAAASHTPGARRVVDATAARECHADHRGPSWRRRSHPLMASPPTVLQAKVIMSILPTRQAQRGDELDAAPNRVQQRVPSSIDRPVERRTFGTTSQRDARQHTNMPIDTVTHVRTMLADAGFAKELVADDGRLCVESSDECYAPADLAVAQLVRFRGITTAEEEGLLFALATTDGRPLGTYVPAYHPATAASDAAIVEQLHEHVISDHEVQSHARHDHIAAVFDDRKAALAAVDELRQLGVGSDRLGLAVREGADRAYERDAERDAIHDTEVGVAAGAAIGFLAGMSIAAVALIPGGVIGLGGILALGVPTGLGGAMLGGFMGGAVAERAFTEREELSAVPLEPGQVLVATCSYGHAGTVEAVMERHGGDLLMRTRTS